MPASGREIERGWQQAVRALPLANGIWRYSRTLLPGDPTQGWKIHLSASPLSAAELLSRVRPLLTAVDVLFKVPQTMGILVEMNSGVSQFSQVGKFLTIYPRSTTEAVKFAALLHRLTRDLRGPEIPFDKRYRRNSIVYYRYGAFRSKGKRSEDGTLRDPAGKIHQDERAAGRAVPTWLEDPFQKAGARPPRPSGRIGLDYLPFRTLSQRGKGGVYEALDLSVSPARRVILKEGRPQGEIDFRGRDGCARVRHEARVLRRLHRRGLPVPKVMAEFGQGGKRFLVLEKLSGRPLFSEKRGQPANPSWRRAEKILNQLQPLLARIHATGWVWRDCKPSHILIRRGGMHLIDFEGACRINDTTAMPWSSPHYIRPEKKRGLARRRGTWEDDYALGVIAFQCLTGEFPSLQARERKRVYRREACAGALRDRIERLLVGP